MRCSNVEPLELLALTGGDVDTGVQREPARTGSTVQIDVRPLQSGRHGLLSEIALSNRPALAGLVIR